MRKRNGRFFLGLSCIAVSAILSCLLYQASASQNFNMKKNITIGVDDYLLTKLRKYPLPKEISFGRNKSIRDEMLRNLPCYPLAKKLISVTAPRATIFSYETAAEPGLVARFFVAEMKRRGWNLCPTQFPVETILFQNKEATCLFNADRDSGITTVTVIYLPIKAKQY